MAENSLAERYEERSEKAADALRAAMLGLATAGIGASYAVHNDFAHHAYWLAVAMAFVAALACTMRSWFLVKDRALRRRDAALKGEKPLKFGKWDRRSSWPWDTAAAWLLIVGAASLAIGLA